MTHTVGARETGNPLPYLQRLWDSVFAAEDHFEERLERLLAEETAEFGLDVGFCSHIDVDTGTQQFDVVHGGTETVRAGATVPLGETYCRKTIAEPDGTMAISDAVAEGWGDDPAYEAYGLGSYLGTTVSLGGDLYGTLCFVSADPRGEPFTGEETTLVELHAQWVAYELQRGTGPPSRTPVSGPGVDRDVSKAQVDTMMDVLRNRTRRSVLLALVDTTPATSLDALLGSLDGTGDRVSLRHRHLPKLADVGYVEWDPEAGTISRGPRFAEVEPLVRLLWAYRR